ncbi:MAG: glycerol-3-phosphate 1-O-acyltransferase PlsY [bacterium]
MDSILALIIIVVLSYIAGAIPSAVIISKLFYGFDIREKGSGNMGSTNAFRVLGWKWGVVVQIADVLKGLFAVLVIARLFDVNYNFGSSYFENQTIIMIIAGISSVIGHIYSFFVGFKGGKGISTTAGMLLGVAPIEVGIALGIFLIAVTLSGYISLGSILAALSLPSSLLFRYNIFGVNIPGYHILIYFISALALLLVFAHRSNIKRLLKGTENRFNKLHLIKLKQPK